MKVKDFFRWSKKEFNIEMELMRVKGKEYTVSDEDKLKNFCLLIGALIKESKEQNGNE